MTSDKNLEQNLTDLTVAVGKSVVGIVPIIGPFLTELVGTLIPNQRIDRLTEYVKILDEKLNRLPIVQINNLLTDHNFIDLLEEGFVQATRAITKERREYIASIISNGISDETIDLIESKYLLRLLQELNEIEIIWLRSYCTISNEIDVAFRNKHINVLTPISASKGSDNQTHNKAAIQSSYQEHLERLELIKKNIRVDVIAKRPVFNRHTGEPATTGMSITILGKLLLSHIGMIDLNTK